MANHAKQSGKRPLRVFHVITSLDMGGAEMMLYKLLAGPLAVECESRVASLLPHGDVSAMISRLGVSVETLGMHNGMPDPRAVLRLARMIRGANPDVVQTWLYHADLMGLLAARMARRGAVVWNIRCANVLLEHYRRTTAWTRKACAAMSGLPAAVVANSYDGMRVHVAAGYAPKRFVVIPNAFDTERFTPNDIQRAAVRNELGLAHNTPVVGMVARFDRMKGHRVFCQAAGILLRKRPEARFLLIGEGVDETNIQLLNWSRENDLGDSLLLMGRRAGMEKLYTAMDVATNASHGEGFPNVVGEAMACGVPCVVTDVGDSAWVVGDTGIVVRPDEPAELAAGWERLLDLGAMERKALGRKARDRIIEHFSIEGIQKRYHELYREVSGFTPVRDNS
ncbi:MAG: glycosyltransferase [Desulfatibacillaceae bacterium]